MFNTYEVKPYFDEMLKSCGEPKLHYQNFYNILNRFSVEELKEKHETAQLSFLRQGITFTVYNNNTGAERTMPFDFIPIIIPPEDWETIQKGMIQRTEALNCFLQDIYHKQKIIKDGRVQGIRGQPTGRAAP